MSRACVTEREPHFCDVICRRYQEFTGTLPVLERTGLTAGRSTYGAFAREFFEKLHDGYKRTGAVPKWMPKLKKRQELRKEYQAFVDGTTKLEALTACVHPAVPILPPVAELVVWV